MRASTQLKKCRLSDMFAVVAEAPLLEPNSIM